MEKRTKIRRQRKRQLRQKEKRFHNRASVVLSTFLIVGVLNWMCWPIQIIGQDVRYNIFFIFLPLLVGMIILALFNREYVQERLSLQKQTADKLVYGAWFIVLGLLTSYVSFGVAADMCWKGLNSQLATKGGLQTFECPVTKIVTSFKASRPYLNIAFQGKTERVYVTLEDIEALNLNSPTNYTLVLNTKKGLWNYYVLQDWQIRRSR